VRPVVAEVEGVDELLTELEARELHRRLAEILLRAGRAEELGQSITGPRACEGD
jgi:hypothetical protein